MKTKVVHLAKFHLLDITVEHFEHWINKYTTDIDLLSWVYFKKNNNRILSKVPCIKLNWIRPFKSHNNHRHFKSVSKTSEVMYGQHGRVLRAEQSAGQISGKCRRLGLAFSSGQTTTPYPAHKTSTIGQHRAKLRPPWDDQCHSPTCPIRLQRW